MKFTSDTGPYLSVFYFLGMSPYHPDTDFAHVKDNQINILILAQIASIILSLSCAVILGIDGSNRTLNPVEIIVILYIICDIAKALCVTFQCVLYKCQIREIFHAFHKLESYFVIHFNHRISYEMFRRKCHLYTLLIFIGFAQYLFVYILRCVYKHIFPTYTIQAHTVHFIQSLTYLHMIFYIEAVAFYIRQLTSMIQRDMNIFRIANDLYKISNRNLIRNKIKCYKFVHFRLWEMTQRVNVFFGWSMIIIFSHAFVKFVYTIYRVFEEFHSNNGWEWICMLVSDWSFVDTLNSSRLFFSRSILFLSQLCN